MARKTAKFVVKENNRDKGKIFIITEMSASQAEAWATRVLLALMATDVDIPENVTEIGAAGLAAIGLRSLGGLKWEIAEPLLEEMMDCVQIQPDPKLLRKPEEEDIEEVYTRIQLKTEVWNLHMGFLVAVLPSLGVTAQKQGAPAKPTVVSHE